MDNRKIQRINTDIFRILTTVVNDKLNNQQIQGVIVTSVQTSADLSTAKVFVEIEDHQEEILKELQKASSFLRNELSHLKIRHIPELRFILDKGKENAKRVDELLAKINVAKKTD